LILAGECWLKENDAVHKRNRQSHHSTKSNKQAKAACVFAAREANDGHDGDAKLEDSEQPAS
jgi:hypothetical protein